VRRRPPGRGAERAHGTSSRCIWRARSALLAAASWPRRPPRLAEARTPRVT
jgi:hypothetical protein